jgi:nucleotide-binding universal stress UspA family protein
MSMKSILVCTDFSSGSKNAIRYAAKLSAAVSAELVLVHIIHRPGEVPLPKDQDLELNAKLLVAATDLRRTHKIKVRTEKREGLPVDEILSIAKKLHVSLIVTGAKETAAGSGLVGGLVYDLMHASLFPVLAVPMGAAFTPFHEIVLAMDPKSRNEYDDSVLLHFIEAFHSQLVITAVAEPGVREKTLKDAATVSIEMRYAELMHKLQVIEHKELDKGVQVAIRENDAELLVIIPHRNHYIDRMMKLTKTQKVLRNINVPLLTLPRILG